MVVIKFFVCVECSRTIVDHFEVGREIGKLIRENSWVLIDYGANSDDLVNRTTLGFVTLAGAIGACIVLDDLRIAGMSTYVIKAGEKK
jgi:hypothetical protein